MARLLNIFENLFLFVFMHQMVQGDQTPTHLPGKIAKCDAESET
jgi:hypothetical protein